MFITPVFSTGSTGKNDELVRILEEELQQVQKQHPTLRAEYFGGPSVGVYNARQIKQDTIQTEEIDSFDYHAYTVRRIVCPVSYLFY